MGANGTTTLNFGAFPGSPEASDDVSGQSGLVAASRLDAWVMPITTADHSADEHLVEALDVKAVYKLDGTLTVKGVVVTFPALRGNDLSGSSRSGSTAHRLFGQFSVGWVWI